METKRLILRPRTKEMIQNWLTQSPEEQMKFLSIDTSEELKVHQGQCERILKMGDRQWHLWDFIERSTSKVIGNGGFHNWMPKHERSEIGYRLYESYWNKGFMSEAIEKIVEFGFHKMNLNRIEAFVSPDNFASIRLVEKMGFQKEGVLREHYKMDEKTYDSIVYGLLKSDFFKNVLK